MTTDGDLVDDQVPPERGDRPGHSDAADGDRPIPEVPDGDEWTADPWAGDEPPTESLADPASSEDRRADVDADTHVHPGSDVRRSDVGGSGAGPPATIPLAEQPAPQDRERSQLRSIVEWVAVVVGALLVATIIKTFLIQAFWIPSESMQPTLMVKDRVLVNKLSYDLHDVHRGDVVVFERPPGETEKIKDLIKRVVATEGDTLTLENGKVLVNGKKLDEPYLAAGSQTVNICSFTGTVKVPKHHVFVMGDNRGNSKDSRCFGPIDEDLIVGRAFVRVWPLTALGTL